MLQELAGQLDLERIHFSSAASGFDGDAQAAGYVYPCAFVLGWSLLEAMAGGCYRW